MAACTEGIASISPPATPKPFPVVAAVATSSLNPTDDALLGSVPGSFSHPKSFNPIYQRNNKKGNIKNLRCFPACAKDSHKHRGFCGRSVSVGFELPPALAPASALHSFVEFAPESTRSPPARLLWEQAQTLLRSKSEPTRPWIPGVAQYPSASATTDTPRTQYYEYNTELKGWHYSWESNKHKCDTKHHLVAMLYERQGDWLVLRSYCASPSFILFCRRRKRFVLDHAEPEQGEEGAKRTKVEGDNEDEDDGATAALMAFMNCPRE